MSQYVCVDASLAAKWLLREHDRSLALQLRADIRGRGDEFIAPYHLPGEVASAIYKSAQTGKISPEVSRLTMARIIGLNIELINTPELPVRAYEIAATFRLKWIYDALYVALADVVGCDMWTADASLHAAVRDAFPNVHLLTELQTA